MSKAWTIAVASGAGALLVCRAAMGAATLPFGEQFSASWATNDSWSAVQTEGAVGAVSNASDKISGTYGVAVSNASLTLAVVTNGQSNVWIQVYAKPQAGASDPTITDNVSGAFYLQSNGTVRVLEYNGSTNVWTNATASLGAGVDGDTWYGFLVHADYGARKWDLYANSAYGASYQCLQGGIRMNPTASNNLSSVTVECGQRTCIDAVALTRAFWPSSATPPTYVMPKEFAAPTNDTSFQLPVYSDIYTNAGYNRLDGRLGQELGAPMHVSSDKLNIYMPTNDMKEFVWQTAINVWSLAGATATNAITPLTEMQLHVLTASGSTWGFYPYNTALVVEGVQNPLAPPISVDFELYGRASGHNGYTSLDWPSGAVNINNTTDFPFNNIANPGLLDRGDLLFVETATVGRYNQYWYETANNKWMDGVNPANRSVTSPQKIWIQQRQTGSTNNTVNITL
jgi:hypothetical protein